MMNFRKFIKLIILVNFVMCSPLVFSGELNNTNSFARKVGIYDLSAHNSESQSNLESVKQAMQVCGLPFIVSNQVEDVVQCAVVIATSTVYTTTLNVLEKNELAEYVWNGGILLLPKVRDTFFYPVLGITGYERKQTCHEMTWLMESLSSFKKWFNDPYEITIRIFNPEKNTEGIITQSFTIDDASVLAEFDDGSPAITRNTYGKGMGIALGFTFSDMILQNLTNHDINTQRVYSNGFEPTTDTIYLFLLSIFEEYIPYSVRKHTSPSRSTSSLILTHDVDASTSMEHMLYFARSEMLRDIYPTYFITTRYVSDAIYGNYYNDKTIPLLRKLYTYNSNIQSHSVGHFLDFNVIELGSPGNTKETYSPHYIETNVSAGATVYGELEVSKNLLETDIGTNVIAFRAGHLLVNKYLFNVLDDLGYLYDSSQSANDVLTNFPYFTQYNNSVGGVLTKVIELPMTISDVYGTIEYSEENVNSIISNWLDVVNKNAANYAPTVLLIHPTLIEKLAMQEKFLDQLPTDIEVTDLASYGDFWRNRYSFSFETELTDNTLHIIIDPSIEQLDERISLTINNGVQLSGIKVTYRDQPVTQFEQNVWEDQDVILSNIQLPSITFVDDAFLY